MSLDNIGFYTLSEERAKNSSSSSPLWRCEMILTGRCNFSCPYCRKITIEDLPFETASSIIEMWAKEGLKNIRFSGGEPTVYNRLTELVKLSRNLGIERIAISTNGSASIELYDELIDAGINDFSISLDACCSDDGDKMAGGINGAWEIVVNNIREISKKVYTTVGVVLTERNSACVKEIIEFADNLGVADIRVIPAAQKGCRLNQVDVSNELLNKHPILKYRINNVNRGLPVRGLTKNDCSKCPLVLDDMAMMGENHYPCIIYLRERGKPIGKIGPDMRKERENWFNNHNTFDDEICRKNCLDVCVDYNNTWSAYH